MITRGELKGRILRLLNKTTANQGFYSDDKINDAIQETLDFIAVEMFLADEGWQTKIQFFTTVANQIKIDIPPHISMIKEVRYTWDGGTTYTPMTYDAANGKDQFAPGTGVSQYGSTYRIVDNAFYFNPVLASGGTDALMVEYMAYPAQILDDNGYVDSHFDNCMQHYIKYKCATILAASFGKALPDWAVQENAWYAKMLAIVTKRNAQVTPIREFG